VKRRFLALDQAVPGMCLGEDVQDAHGALLLAAGGELTGHLLDMLQRRGIHQICVAEPEVPSTAEREALREAVRARLSYLFRGAGPDEADRQLFDSVLAYRLEQLG